MMPVLPLIVADSCCDLPDFLRSHPQVRLVPFFITLEGQEYTDDATMDVPRFITQMAASPTPPRSACPSPHDYQVKFAGADDIFVITISSQLSNSYNSARVAVTEALEEGQAQRIHIFDSRSASAGETLICLYLLEQMAKGLDFAAIVAATEAFIQRMETRFLLESLEHLAKNGRLRPMVAKLADALAIKPIMGATRQGEIVPVEKLRGYQRALRRLAELAIAGCQEQGKTMLVIAYCNCRERALFLRETIGGSCPELQIYLVETAGLSTTYADDGGIVIAY